MNSYNIRFCEGCDNYKKKYCAGKNLLPQISFVDFEKLRKEHNKSEDHSCDLVYDAPEKLGYIENKHIYYFARFFDSPKEKNLIESSLCGVIRDKIEDSLDLYESLYPIQHSNRFFILFFSEKVPFPKRETTEQINIRMAKLYPNALKFFLINSISAIKNFKGMQYIHSSGKKVKVYIDECTNAPLHFQ